MENNISLSEHEALCSTLNKLIKTILTMRPSYFLHKNLREAEDWLKFLSCHTDKEELMSLEKEIAERFAQEYECSADNSSADTERIQLIKELIAQFRKYLYQ
ncbi:MAG: hypothetical protein IJ446_07090 [Oscillospiraceae bacterium]|nr:hypothetical protein [Oscillospiraceae bacterium]